MKTQDFTKLSNEELRKNLITNDFKGQTFKEGCLNELIRRSKEEQFILSSP